MAHFNVGDFIVFYENSEFQVSRITDGPRPREGRKPLIHYREVRSHKIVWWKPWTWSGAVVKVRKAEDFEKTTGAKLQIDADGVYRV